MTKFTPPLWENVRAALRDGLQTKLATLERDAQKQNLGDDMSAALDAQIKWAKGDVDGAKKRLTAKTPGPYSKLILGHLHLDAGDAQQAAQMFEQASQGGVTDPRLAAGKGAVALIKGHAKDAVKLLAQAVEQDAKDWHARYLLGLAQSENGDLAAARDSFARVVKERASFTQAWLGFAAMSVALGRAAEAAQIMEKNVKAHPDQAALQIAFADCLRSAGDFDRAISVLTPFAAKSGEESFLLDYCELCLAAGRLSVAAATLDVVFELDEKSARGCILRGHLAEMSEPRQLEDAVSWYKKSIAIAPKNVRAKTSLGLLLMRDTKVKDWAEAGRVLTSALEDEKPAAIAPLLNLAILRVSEGKNEEAKKLASQVLARKPTDRSIVEQAERIVAAAK